MNIQKNDPPRAFPVGAPGREIILRDCGRIALEPDEQVTFVTPGGAEFDVLRKSWGFYATPSLNKRLLRFGLRAALVRGHQDTYFIHLAEADRVEAFHAYLRHENLELVCWLHDPETLRALTRLMDHGDAKAD